MLLCPSFFEKVSWFSNGIYFCQFGLHSHITLPHSRTHARTGLFALQLQNSIENLAQRQFHATHHTHSCVFQFIHYHCSQILTCFFGVGVVVVFHHNHNSDVIQMLFVKLLPYFVLLWPIFLLEGRILSACFFFWIWLNKCPPDKSARVVDKSWLLQNLW